MKKTNHEYVLTLNEHQAREACKAVELLMRLKLGQWDQIPYMLLDLGDKDYCKKRDDANPLLHAAFNLMAGENRVDAWRKDTEWYRLYNLYQVLRHALWQTREIMTTGDNWCVDAEPPRRFTDEPLPKIEIIRHVEV